MEFVIRVAAPLPVLPRLPVARRRVLALAERDGLLCRWCGLKADLEWPVGHPAAPVATRTGSGEPEDVRLAHRFCDDPANRKFDRSEPDATVRVRRARLAFAVELARTPGDHARRWRRFDRGSDRQRTTVAHLRSMARIGVRPGLADVAAVATGPLSRSLYEARVRRWSHRPLPTADQRSVEVRRAD
ncbi:hypothetical protein AB0I60_04495 [Actinosynnema sp. NPDC050436]|uniref:hypothetical protein n=1 Tax=Actinosynnema sp. NPDC050436 TaxID=3155659 RepID=UPI0033C86F4C